ncbi:hypothetical protein D3C75_1257520 [compost metagenome]
MAERRFILLICEVYVTEFDVLPGSVDVQGKRRIGNLWIHVKIIKDSLKKRRGAFNIDIQIRHLQDRPVQSAK